MSKSAILLKHQLLAMKLIFHLEYWPLLTGLWFICTFAVSFAVSVSNDHVYYFFPYISDTGAHPPESCIFGQMLNIGAVLLLITMYFRLRVVALLAHSGYIKNYYTSDWKRWNNVSIFFGFFSCLGMSVVANFQETSVVTAHFVGAFMAFGIGAVYCIIHAYLTWMSNCGMFLKYGRIFLSAVLIPLYTSTIVFTMISFDHFNGNNQFQWTEKYAGYQLHLAATFSEWSMSVCMILFVISFYSEFRLVKFDEISFVLR